MLDIGKIIGEALFTLGGLMLFLYGIKLLSYNLQRISSERLKSFFDFLTRNKLMGVTFGAIVTSILQSSSATTVMLIGFANAGVIKLTQAISIIFGANIGTTITAQIIAFNASKIAIPLIGIGGILYLFFKRVQTKSIGEILIGLGLLFYGLKLMGTYLKPLKDNQVFLDIMINMGQYPLIGIVVGMVITMIIQSSSATTGMIITLGALGAIDFRTAFILELGSNIGTTITAQIAAIGTNTTSKRVAWGHTLFNVIGSLYMWILLYVTVNGQPIFLHFINRITPGNGFVGENIARHIANAHTFFNIMNAVILFPFINQIAKLTELIIKEQPDRYEKDIKYLDERMAKTPVIALKQATLEARRMMEITKDMSRQVYQTLFRNKEKAIANIHNRDAKLTRMQNQIVTFLVQINHKLKTQKEYETSNAVIHIAEHLKRIGDHHVDIIDNFQNLISLKKGFPQEKFNDMRHYYQTIQEMFFTLMKAFPGEEHDPEAVETFYTYINTAQDLEDTVRKDITKLIRKKEITPKAGYYFGEILGHLDFIRDQLNKIAAQLKSIK